MILTHPIRHMTLPTLMKDALMYSEPELPANDTLYTSPIKGRKEHIPAVSVDHSGIIMFELSNCGSFC